MKKILVFIMAACLFAASCNDNKNGMNTNNRERDDYRNNDNRNNDNRNNNRDDDNYDDNNNSGGWTSAQKSQWMRSCADPLSESMGEDRAKSYCSCILEKMQEKYSSFDRANREGTEEQGAEWGRECVRELGLDGN